MTTLPVPVTDTAIAERLADYQNKAAGALAPNTERALRADTGVFTAWCADNGHRPLPASPDALVGFIDAQAAEKSTATVSRYMASIARLHRAGGLDSPTETEDVKLALKRMRRSNGSRQRQAAAVKRHHVDRMLKTAGDRLIDVRNKAMLAVAYD